MIGIIALKFIKSYRVKILNVVKGQSLSNTFGFTLFGWSPTSLLTLTRVLVDYRLVGIE